MVGVNVARRHFAGVGVVVRASVVAMAVVVAGCSSLTPKLVSPTLDGKAVAATVREHQTLMTALQADADVIGYSSADWYEVSLAGFNYVDDQCAVYFDSLFAFNRQTSAIKSGLSAFNQTAAAIMQITGTAEVTMGVIAQAFGLAGSMTDVVAGTFLYELPPANTRRFVEKTMAAYKNAASQHRQTINSRASAYSTMRGYLNLCLPVTIEGQLIDRISDTKAQSTVESTGTNIEIDVRSSASTGLLDNAGGRLRPVRDDVLSPDGAGWVEQHIGPSDWRKIQRAICAPEDGIPGTATHAAIAEFFEGRGEPDTGIPKNGIGSVQLSILSAVVGDANGRTCSERQAANAFEVGRASK
jgi:hypothetical protein